jgi:hypothetical protein
VQRQLAAIARDLESAETRVRSMYADLPGHQWHHRPAPDAWSAAECVAHLNLTSQALLPLVRDGLTEARNRGPVVARRYRRDPLGWLIWTVVAPSGRFKTRTVPAFTPSTAQAAESLVADFTRLQSELVACVHEAEGLSIDQVTLTSPFDARLRYNLYAALTVVPRHQRRHLLQAERAASAGVPLGAASALALR